MRGKKCDVEFVSQFIIDCANNNFCTPEQIINEANKQIEEINNQIKEVESKKIIRSKLLDVVFTFKENKINQDETKDITLFKIKNHHICKYICQSIKDKPVTINNIVSISKFDNQDILFCIKQLLEYKVISKVGDYFLRGDKFGEYNDLIIKEV